MISFSCRMSACVTPRETSHSPKGSLVCICTFVNFSSVLELIFVRALFAKTLKLRRHRKAVRNLWSRFEVNASTAARVAGSQSFFSFRWEWIRRFPGFSVLRPILYQSDNEYKLDLENNKYKLDSGTVEIEATYSSITSMKIIQYAFGGGDV